MPREGDVPLAEGLAKEQRERRAHPRLALPAVSAATARSAQRCATGCGPVFAVTPLPPRGLPYPHPSLLLIDVGHAEYLRPRVRPATSPAR